jgi:ferric iron reductase protein FhuF
MSRVHPLLQRLAPLLTGSYANYATAFVTAPPAGAEPGDLRDPATLAARLSRFAYQYGEADGRGVATLWSKHHFAALLAPALAANLVLRRDLPVELPVLRTIAGPDGRTTAFLVPDGDDPAGGEGPERFDAIVEGHLRPMIDVLSAATRLSPRVLWSNAGAYLEAVINALGAVPQVDAAGLVAARALLSQPRLADGRPNPLAQPVRYLGAPPQRVRRVCCLRYLIPSLTLCGTCPLPGRPA